MRISGTVVSQVDSEALVGAVVEVLSADSTRISVTQTDVKGKFNFNLPMRDKMILKTKAIGFAESSLLISGNQEKLNVGYIYLTDKSVELQEVTVTGAGIIEKVDKYIIIPSAEQLKRSAGSMYLLNNLSLPGLDVNIAQRSASINGEGIVYQINGVPKSLNEVQAINTYNVLRVEYSDNPSIRYINKGAGGVINFILKKNETGGNLYESFYASPTCSAFDNNTRFSLNYKKSEFSLNYIFTWRDYYKKIVNTYDEYNSPDNSIIRESIGRDSPMTGYNNDIRATYTYQHDLNSIFNATFLYSVRPGYGSFYSDDLETINNQITKYTEYSKYNTYTKSPSLDLFYKRKLKKDQTLELNVVGTYMDTNHDREKYRTYTDRNEEFISGVTNKKWSIISEIAYSKTLKKVSLRFGFQDTYSNTNNEYKEPYSKTKLLYNDAYIYGEMLGKIKRVTYSVGTGLKILSLENYNNSKTYYNNLSTIKVKYSPIKGLSFDYLMMYKPNIPSLSQLDDIIQPIDNILKNSGNPSLKPSNWLRNRIFVNYSYKKIWSRVWAIYDREFNPIVNNMYYDNGYFISKPININYGSKINLQFDFGVKELWNHLDLRGSLYWNKYTTDNYLEYHHTLSNVTVKFEAVAYWGDWSIYANYSPLKGEVLKGEDVIIKDSDYYIQLQYKWRNFSFSVGGSYFFADHGRENASRSLSKINPSKSMVYIKENANWINLGVTYNLNFGRKYKKMNKSMNNSDTEGSAIIVQK